MAYPPRKAENPAPAPSVRYVPSSGTHKGFPIEDLGAISINEFYAEPPEPPKRTRKRRGKPKVFEIGDEGPSHQISMTESSREIQEMKMAEPIPPAATTPQPAAVITEPEPESKMGDVFGGFKDGAVKGAADRFFGSIVGPIKANVAPKIIEMTGNPAMVNEIVELALLFILMLGSAAAVEWAMPMLGKALPGDKSDEAAKRGRVVAKFLRHYAGEKCGAKVVDGIMFVAPIIIGNFSKFATEDFENAVNRKDELEQEQEAEA